MAPVNAAGPSYRAVALAAGVCACGGGGAAGPPDAPYVFIAFPSSFASFRTWASFHSDGPVDDGSVPPDVLGPRTQYLNQPPPHGATAFPIGTIIVEAREDAAHTIFAGVKRGYDYNPTGAHDWEWFELAEDPTGKVLIVWRGVGPPDNTHYGGDPNGGCNGCHAACGAGNDYVCSPRLQLADF
jgi:hypothetical protein